MTLDDLTTLLELAGMLVILAGVAVAVWPFYPPAALAVVGLGLIGIAWLIDRGRRKGRAS